MFDLTTIISSLAAVLSAGGWLMSHNMRKREEERHNVDMERARAEADALRQKSELDYTKDILELYSAHIVQPLKDQIKQTNNRIDNYEKAINHAVSCSKYPDCPVISMFMQDKTNNNSIKS